MNLEFQKIWGDLIVLYLFLGGLGGACLTLASIAVYSKRILPIIAPWASVTLSAGAAEESEGRPNRVFTLTMSLSGVVFLGVGSLMLLLDLLNPGAVLYLLSSPHSWIFWGTLFIAITLISGAIYSWAQAVPTFAWLREWVAARIPADAPARAYRTMRFTKILVAWFASVGQALQKIERPSGYIAGGFGFATAFYTGFLVSVAPAVPLWNTPALPLLFLVSAFSTAAAYALLVLAVIRPYYQKGLEQRIEGFDVGLIVFEILILLAYFNFGRIGPVGAQMGLDFLLKEPGFWLGVLVLGLVVPLGLEFFGLWQKNPKINLYLSATSAVLVLVGGYLLRYYVLKAGVFQFPW